MPHHLVYLLEQLWQFWLKKVQLLLGRSSHRGPLSWFHKWTAGLHLLAPCRMGRWRNASAMGRCSPRGRCEGRARTGWGHHIQNPSCRSHILSLSSQRGQSQGQRCLWEDAGWVLCAARCGLAPPQSADWPDDSHPGWGGTLAQAECAPETQAAPGRAAGALRAGCPPRSRSAATGHPHLVKTDSSPLNWDHHESVTTFHGWQTRRSG